MKTILKTKISFILLIFIAQLSFAQVFNFNYDNGITKEKALENAKYYEQDLLKYDYQFARSNVKSSDNYDIIFNKKSKTGDGVLTTKISYFFSDKSVKVEIVNSFYNSQGSSYEIKPNATNQVYKNLYDANKNLYVDVFMQYVNLK